MPEKCKPVAVRIVHVASLRSTLRRFVEPLRRPPSEDAIEYVVVSGDESNSDGQMPVQLHIGRTNGSVLVSWLLFANNANILASLNPCGIHVHTPATAIALRPTLSIMRRRGVKLIYTARGGFDEGGNWARRTIWSLVNPLRWRIWDGVCVTNEHLLAEARRFGHSSARKISLGAALPNVEMPIPHEGDPVASTEAEPFSLAWVGRLDRDKRFEDFVNVVQILNRLLPRGCVGHAIGLSVLGDKPPLIPTHQEIKFHGHVDVPAVIVGKCDLLISTSVREGYGLGPLEAALVGTPTIAIANHGTRESVPLVGGSLVEPGQLDRLVALAQGIAELSEAEISRLRHEVQEKARALLCQSDPAEEILDLYRAIFL